MYRVELKDAMSPMVANSPRFLMYRVELKDNVKEIIPPDIYNTLFLMYRVELKVYNPNLLCLGCLGS